MTRNLISALLGILSLSVGASATTLTFDSVGDCATADVTITAGAGAAACVFGVAPGGSAALVKDGGGDSFWTATFTSAVSFVSVDLGDYNADEDRLFLTAYGVGDAFLGTTTLDISASFNGMETLSLSGLGPISKAVFGTTIDLGTGGGIYADNLTFRTTTSDVPEPSTLLLLGGCLLGGAVLRRRRETR